MIKYEMRFYMRSNRDYWLVESAFTHERNIVAGDLIKIASGEKLEVKEVGIDPTDDHVVCLRLESLPVPLLAIAFYESELLAAGMSIEKGDGS